MQGKFRRRKKWWEPRGEEWLSGRRAVDFPLGGGQDSE